MFHIANLAKARLGMVVGTEQTTVEEGYEVRKEYVKRISDVTQAVQSASSKVVLALAELASTLEELQSTFESLDDVTQMTAHEKSEAELALEQEEQVATLTTVCALLKTQLSEFRLQDIGVFEESLRSELRDPLESLDTQQQAVEELRQARIKAVKSYDAARVELQVKEREYLSKGRPLTESKAHPQLLSVSQDAKAAYDSASEAFASACDALMEDSRCVAAQCLQAALHRTLVVVGRLGDRLQRVLDICES